MGSCFGKRSAEKQNSTNEREAPSLNTNEKNKLKLLVFINKAGSAPRLDLESSNLYQKRRTQN